MNPDRAIRTASGPKATASKMGGPRPFIAPDYVKKIDFVDLARQDAEFANVVRGTGGQVRWDNPEHVR
jgi:hypothetical protein